MENLTLTGLLKQVAVKYPDRRAISLSGQFDITHARLDQLIEHAASLLLSAGVKPADVVALTFPNTVEFIIMFLAVIRVRATAAPLNAAYTSDEFEFYLSDSESKLLLTSKQGNEPVQAAASKLNIPHITATLPTPNSEISLSPTQSETNSISRITNESSDISLFLHTSGTTSRPKGVPLSQLNLASSVQNIKSVYKLTESDSTVIVLPLFHVHGLIAALLSSLVAGASVTLPAAGRFSASTFWADMNKYNATWYTAVPTIHQIILDCHLNKPEPIYPNLRFIRSCSAALAPSIMERLEEAFKAPVLEAYAMTEASHLMASNPLPESGPHIPGSVGKPVGQEMAILNENGVVQEAGASGEVCIRGPNVTKGYKNSPEANRAAFQSGWFHTGDIGYLDSNGYLHLVGRIKELINRGGEKISPIEVDAVLLSHPDITQAVCFGVPDDKYGEEINCAVILKEGSDIDEAEVLSFCKKNLAAFKVPKKANASSGVAVEDNCKLKFQELKKRNHRFIIYKIEGQQVVVEKLGGPDESYEDFTNSLPANECRFAVFDFDFTTSENCQKSKIFFIAWSPDTSNVRMKMVYASSKDRFKREFDGVQVDLQATDPSEMSFDIIKGRVN